MASQPNTKTKPTKLFDDRRKALPKGERIDLRLSLAAKTLLQRAAFEKHKTVSEFVLERGLMAAAETLADRQFFLVDEKRWKAFQTALDAPTKSKPRLEALLKSPSALE